MKNVHMNYVELITLLFFPGTHSHSRIQGKNTVNYTILGMHIALSRIFLNNDVYSLLTSRLMSGIFAKFHIRSFI
jgi:hypothetical protein